MNRFRKKDKKKNVRHIAFTKQKVIHQKRKKKFTLVNDSKRLQCAYTSDGSILRHAKQHQTVVSFILTGNFGCGEKFRTKACFATHKHTHTLIHAVYIMYLRNEYKHIQPNTGFYEC